MELDQTRSQLRESLAASDRQPSKCPRSPEVQCTAESTYPPGNRAPGAAGPTCEQVQLLNEARDNLKREFENLANRIFEDKGKSFTTTSRESLESLLKPFREQITGFQSRINEVHSESVRGNTALEKEIQKVLDVGLEMNSQATNLTSALKGDKKTAGNWGEAQLQRTLELAGLQAGEHYDAQASFKDEQGKRKLPDFVIRLPEGKNLIIDSKVSLVDYDRAISAETE